ncbi:unnamed protein product [Spirodela intermedia]|uniref:Stigma-specific Stig1 family protein n=1 Tax=Spirodela intermedia TaxID=51605 RepID=A0ABN7E986_SPIIN|nr:unnamed protein product [Spirodela intermedia]
MGKALLYFLVVSLLLGVALSIANPIPPVTENEESGVWAPDEAEKVFSLRRLLRYGSRQATLTCDRVPKVCRVIGSPGRNCCRKRCVNLRTDTMNCGRCGKRCRYEEACCLGTCVNILFNRSNCGACNRRCEKGNNCRYGMCNYA